MSAWLASVATGPVLRNDHCGSGLGLNQPALWRVRGGIEREGTPLACDLKLQRPLS